MVIIRKNCGGNVTPFGLGKLTIKTMFNSTSIGKRGI